MPIAGSLRAVSKPPRFETLSLHGGQEPDPVTGARAPPLYQTTSYNFSDADDGASKFAWSKDGYVYTRMGNPTNAVLEARMSMLEGGVGAVVTASGHAAQFMAITTVCEPGYNFISTTWLYGGTYNQFRVYLKKFNIHVKFVEGQNPKDIAAAIDEKTRAIYIETIGNPQFNVPDIAAISKVAHEAGIPVIVDNTFGMGGYVCKPFSLGADIITHSCTKWIGGHGTSMGGIVIDGGKFNWANGKFPGFVDPSEGYHGMRFWDTYGYKALTAKLRMDAMRDLGPCMSPFNAWLFLQGLETLSLRGERHNQNALAFAQWLDKHSNVAWVNYPGLPSHSDHALVKRVLNGFGGVLTFGVAGNIDEVAAVVDNLKLCSHLANVGDAKTLILHPWRSTHHQIPDDEKFKGGVTPDMIRVSVGLEHIDDIIHDFAQAFENAGLKNAQGWEPSWKAKGGTWNAGTLYAPKPDEQKMETTNGFVENGHLEDDSATSHGVEGFADLRN